MSAIQSRVASTKKIRYNIFFSVAQVIIHPFDVVEENTTTWFFELSYLSVGE